MLLLMIFVSSIQCILSIQEGMQAICLSLSLLWTKDQRSELLWTKDQLSEGFIGTPNPTRTSNSDGKCGTGTRWLAPSLHQPPEGAHRLLSASSVCVLPFCYSCWTGAAGLPCPALWSPQLFTYWLPSFPWGFISHSIAPQLLGHNVSLRLGTSLQWRLFGVTRWWVIMCKSQLHSYS